MIASVLADSEQAIGRGDFQVVLHAASGPSGARLFGRFLHADHELHQLIRRYLAAEEKLRPGRVFAEVVHLPEGRVGNILCRPVLRGHEIPYLGRSGAPADRQLPLSDLLVSVQGERIVLRSRRLGREVLPRLTTAHNHIGRGLGVYRFLCALQYQQVVPGITWDWGPLGRAPFLPRVLSGRVILSRARWNLRSPELAAFGEPRGARQFAAVQRLRERHRMPRYVALADGDNELVADLDNVLSLETLAHEVKGRALASFVEMIPGPEQLCVSGPEGSFTHQVIVPFVRSSPQPAAQTPRPPAAASCVRRFPPGSDWLYVKLFTGPVTADQVLLRVARAVGSSFSAGGADQWFFVRYGDPDWHLRLRVHGAPDRLLRETLPWLHGITAPLLETGQLWRVQLDTYEREVERYGGEAGIALAERVFHADSDAVLAIVRVLTGDAGAELRWRVALRGVDLLFDDLGLTLEQKLATARQARQGYGSEFGAEGAFQREVSRRYRNERAWLEALLDPQHEPPAELAASIQALNQQVGGGRAGRAGAPRPGRRRTAFSSPPGTGHEPRAHARQPDAALGPAGPGTRTLRAARPGLPYPGSAAAPMTDWDAIFGEAALGLDLAKVDHGPGGLGRSSGCPAVPAAHQPADGPGDRPGRDLPFRSAGVPGPGTGYPRRRGAPRRRADPVGLPADDRPGRRRRGWPVADPHRRDQFRPRGCRRPYRDGGGAAAGRDRPGPGELAGPHRRAPRRAVRPGQRPVRAVG